MSATASYKFAECAECINHECDPFQCAACINGDSFEGENTDTDGDNFEEESAEEDLSYSEFIDMMREAA